MPLMTERIRLTYDVPERTKRAIGIAAARTGRTVGEVIEWLAEELLPEDLQLADRSIAAGAKAPQPKRPRRQKPGEQ
jgi:hypothetical protein